MGYAAILWICLVSECNVLLEQWQMSIQGLLSSSVTSTGGFQARCFQTPDPCCPLYQRHAHNTETVGTASPQQLSVGRNQKGAFIFIYIYIFCPSSVWMFCEGREGRYLSEKMKPLILDDSWPCRDTDCCNFSVISGGTMQLLQEISEFVSSP